MCSQEVHAWHRNMGIVSPEYSSTSEGPNLARLIQVGLFHSSSFVSPLVPELRQLFPQHNVSSSECSDDTDWESYEAMSAHQYINFDDIDNSTEDAASEPSPSSSRRRSFPSDEDYVTHVTGDLLDEHLYVHTSPKHPFARPRGYSTDSNDSSDITPPLLSRPSSLLRPGPLPPIPPSPTVVSQPSAELMDGVDIAPDLPGEPAEEKHSDGGVSLAYQYMGNAGKKHSDDAISLAYHYMGNDAGGEPPAATDRTSSDDAVSLAYHYMPQNPPAPSHRNPLGLRRNPLGLPLTAQTSEVSSIGEAVDEWRSDQEDDTSHGGPLSGDETYVSSVRASPSAIMMLSRRVDTLERLLFQVRR